MIRIFLSPWAIAAWAAASLLLVLWQSLLWLRVRAQFRSWQPVTATIVESWIRTYNEMDGEYVKEPVVKFSYTFNGLDYVSNTPFLRSFTLGPRFVNLSELANQYQKGETVVARLNPERPDECYLGVANFDFKSVFLLAAGILLTGAASYFLSWFIYMDR